MSKYIVLKDLREIDTYRVEHIGKDGIVDQAVFMGPRAQFLANDYVSYMSSTILAGTMLNALVREIHDKNSKWWYDLQTGERLNRNIPEMLMLIVSEISEAMEGHRKGLKDDKLPKRDMLEVELADAVIRIMDLCGGLGLDLGGALVEKQIYNNTRADHKAEARLAVGGKKY